ncbi:S-adenosyl methyltransferase [Saccharopolyspora antimicrobica]|uniref:S-adenosyl methyltransferase n=1 Tax=Saccharopolyspora antimicrobica TaxID=455193 RepID=A0A1I5B715_9PSEU|nr:SAM-dependent methyltransferase [Saccharopolyspora antimicrobica]RKT86489.1 S-adenosyl methyltransferase [Saccharopolyspora antimicrobica]SFN70492.1 S-adenosyl methyltransferase [Saccharopolyspora antimicrobica]
MEWAAKRSAEQRPPVDLRTDVPHSARIYDYLLGGRDNFAADRDAAGSITADWPNLPKSMRANRDFMCRVTRFLAERGYRQFLDIGTGLPTSPNLHEVAQSVDPGSRVLYVDNDPIVLVHARALLTSTPEGRTAYVDADLHQPAAILESAEFAETFDLDEPVVLSLLAIVHFIPDDDEAIELVRRMVEPLPSGSALALSMTTEISAPDEVRRGVAAYNANGIPLKSRTKAEVERFFDGMDVLDPGVVLVNHWHPDAEAQKAADEHVHMYGAVAVKP